eukprot:scaffold25427_cov78-Skeletonema_dohrnii-CCMP3373.AAC.1
MAGLNLWTFLPHTAIRCDGRSEKWIRSIAKTTIREIMRCCERIRLLFRLLFWEEKKEEQRCFLATSFPHRHSWSAGGFIQHIKAR